LIDFEFLVVLILASHFIAIDLTRTIYSINRPCQ